MKKTRREVLAGIGGVGATLTFGCSAEAVRSREEPSPRLDSSPAENIMREHGLIHRLMLIYEELADRIEGRKTVPPGTFLNVTNLVDQFVGSHHERLEEEYIFPILEGENDPTELIKVLRKQHLRGRELATEVYELAGGRETITKAQRTKLSELARGYSRMYRAHAAREDTVLFAALTETIPATQLTKMAARFKKEEAPEANRFDRTVQEVASLEKQLDMHSLAGYTPRID
jgi:hemerythrin-like domain-containing protein